MGGRGRGHSCVGEVGIASWSRGHYSLVTHLRGYFLHIMSTFANSPLEFNIPFYNHHGIGGNDIATDQSVTREVM